VIISHRHRYLFVELPRTGSTAIRDELCGFYDGEPILSKHATYQEFLGAASVDEKRYFVFSAIRNPLDDAVSRYFKLRTDHKGRFSGARPRRHRRLVNRLLDNAMFGFLRRTDADFPTFFLRYYVLPYDTWASLSHRRFDFVMRFENLSADFEKALRQIGIEPVRPLALVNPTGARQRDFAYYYPPETWGRARRVFGPYMEKWGYGFPAEWGIQGPSTLHRAQYLLCGLVARFYWRVVRPLT